MKEPVKPKAKTKAKTYNKSEAKKRIKEIEDSKSMQRCEVAISFLLDEVESMNFKINKLMSRMGLE